MCQQVGIVCQQVGIRQSVSHMHVPLPSSQRTRFSLDVARSSQVFPRFFSRFFLDVESLTLYHSPEVPEVGIEKKEKKVGMPLSQSN